MSERTPPPVPGLRHQAGFAGAGARYCDSCGTAMA
jgi:hypothetical protein